MKNSCHALYVKMRLGLVKSRSVSGVVAAKRVTLDMCDGLFNKSCCTY